MAYFDLRIFFVFLSFFKVYIDLVRLFIPQTPWNKFMNENIRAVEKIKMELFCTQNTSMIIQTIIDVEHGKIFVSIGCGSRNSKRVKSYGRLKKRKKAMECSSIRFDGFGESLRTPPNDRACSQCSARY